MYTLGNRSTHVLMLIVLLALSFPSTAETKKIRVLYEEGADSIGTYCMGMLKLALSRIDHNYELDVITGNYTPARIIEEVRSEGIVNILWGSGEREIEETLLPVRIPLYKGLLGHRVLIIRRGDQARFDHIQTLGDLKTIKLGQGATWADTRVLEHNQLSVIRVNKYPSLFYMLDGARYDGFPRGLQEPWGEIAAWPQLDLTVEKRLMLVYRMPFYLFVSRNNPQLAADLELGFNRAIADGSFDELFFNDPTVRDALSKADIKNRVVIPLDNPLLHPETPLDRPELWLDPASVEL